MGACTKDTQQKTDWSQYFWIILCLKENIEENIYKYYTLIL